MRVYRWALMISFMGSLPIGTLNISVTDLVIHKGIIAAMSFGLAAILVEIVTVGVAVMVVGKLAGYHRLRQFFRVVACVLLFVFAYISLMAAYHMEQLHITPPFIGRGPFLSGLLLSAANPLHLPFWLGWTATLKAKQILQHKYTGYLLGIGSGTALAFLVYGAAGSYLAAFLQEKQFLLNWVVGIGLLGAGVLQGYQYFVVPQRKVSGCSAEA